MKLIKNKIPRVYAILSIALNFVIVFNIFSNSLHELNEHQHTSKEICSPEFEKDACHRYLIHHEESTACNKEHKHISEKGDDCFVCKFFKERQNDLHITSKQLIYIAFYNSFYNTVLSSKIKSLSVFYSYLRGPPVHVS